MKSYIEDLLNHQLIKKSTSPYSSPVVCVRKKDKSLGLCIDYRALNETTIPDRHPIPRGLYKWIRIPLSLTNVPAYFQRFMGACLGDLRDKICIPYVDDVIVFSPTFEDHIQHLNKVLVHLKEHGVKLKPRKCNLFK